MPPSRTSPSCSATVPATSATAASSSASDAASAARFRWCSFGMTRTWVGACGLMSRKASTRSDSWTTSAGISPATMRQNRQSLTAADLIRTPGLPRRSDTGKPASSGRSQPSAVRTARKEPPVTAPTPTHVDWPSDLAELTRRSLVAEYASLTRDGRPITWPVTPYLGEQTGTIDVSTGLTSPARAEPARRDPRVAVLFSSRVAPGVPDPAVVLVQGLATVRDADLQANLDRYVHDSLSKLPGTFQGTPTWALRRSAWYFARIYVQLTPLRITSWPGGRLDREPEVWTASEGTTAPPSDPAPTGPALGTGWAKPAGDWRPFAERAELLGAPVLTVPGADGWPLA